VFTRDLQPSEQNENRRSNEAKHEDDELETEICRFEDIMVGSLVIRILVRKDAFRADVGPPERQVDCNVDKAQSDNRDELGNVTVRQGMARLISHFHKISSLSPLSHLAAPFLGLTASLFDKNIKCHVEENIEYIN